MRRYYTTDGNCKFCLYNSLNRNAVYLTEFSPEKKKLHDKTLNSRKGNIYIERERERERESERERERLTPTEITQKHS